MKNIVEIKGLNKKFFSRNNVVNAVDRVSFNLKKGEIVGLIGESGSGKTTTGRTIMNLHTLDSGSIIIDGKEYGEKLNRKQKKNLYNDVQMIFQDPYSSLNGQKNIYSILKESLVVKKKDKELIKDFRKDRQETLKYYRGTLNEFFWKTYWAHRLNANKEALDAYKIISENMKVFKIDRNKSAFKNYHALREAIFEEKFNANAIILNSVSDIAISVRSKYLALRAKTRKGQFEDTDEKALRRAQERITNIRSEIKASKKLTRLTDEYSKIEAEISKTVAEKRELNIHSKYTIASTLKSIRKEIRVLRKQKRYSDSYDDSLFIQYVIDVKSTIVSLLWKLNRVNKFGKTYFLDITEQVSEMQEALFNKYEYRNIKRREFKRDIEPDVYKIFLTELMKTSDKNLAKLDDKLVSLFDKRDKTQAKIDKEKVISSHRKLERLQDSLAKAKVQLRKAIEINRLEVAKYREESAKKAAVIKETNTTLAEKDTETIKNYSATYDNLLKDLYKQVIRGAFPIDKDFKNKRAERKAIKSFYKKDQKRNGILEFQIRKYLRELKSLKTFISVNSIITKPMTRGQRKKLKKILVRAKIFETLRMVGLPTSNAFRYPHEFSGGMRQRVGIGRAIISDPKVIIADEPIAALDLSIQAQIINLINDIIKKKGLAMIFIAHDLSMIEYNADSLLIMHQGRVVEHGTTKAVFKKPIHPYTKNLIASMPSLRNLKKGFKLHKFDTDYKKEYSIMNEPTYYKVGKDHYVLALEEQFKKWNK